MTVGVCHILISFLLGSNGTNCPLTNDAHRKSHQKSQGGFAFGLSGSVKHGLQAVFIVFDFDFGGVDGRALNLMRGHLQEKQRERGRNE